MKVVQHNASPIDLHLDFSKCYQDHDLLRHIHEVTPLQLVPWIKANILTMYMPLNMDTFHLHPAKLPMELFSGGLAPFALLIISSA